MSTNFPNETFSQIKDTIDVSIAMNLDWYNITILQPLPNTVIFDQMLSDGLRGDISFSSMGYNSGTHGKKVNKSGKVRNKLLSVTTKANNIFQEVSH